MPFQFGRLVAVFLITVVMVSIWRNIGKLMHGHDDEGYYCHVRREDL
jgi:hypothetical protein